MSDAGAITYAIGRLMGGLDFRLPWGLCQLYRCSQIGSSASIEPSHVIRALGGVLYLAGMALMTWNLIKTALAGKAVDGEAEIVPAEPDPKVPWRALLFGRLALQQAEQHFEGVRDRHQHPVGDRRRRAAVHHEHP